MQCPVPVGKHDPGLGCVDELDATLRQSMQELDDVVFVDDRVRELDERLQQVLFTGHAGASYRRSVASVRRFPKAGSVESDATGRDVGRDLADRAVA